MSTYIFILGKDFELSLAELLARFPKAHLKSVGREFVSLQLKQEFGQKDLDGLGGVIKVARLVNSVNFKAVQAALFEQIESAYQGTKLNYGVSVYDWPLKNLRTLLVGLKKLSKKEGVKTRFANQGFKNISSAQYKGLKKSGIEWLVCRDTKALLLGEVVAVQNIDAYSKRDFDKPFRDMKMGMLPPKLAQVLINLTGTEGRIWDPFCGSGTVLMEGLLMGRDMLGSDIAKKHVEGARKNVEWLQKSFDTHSKAELFVHDATKPIQNKKFEAIAAEVDLGKPHSQLISDAELGSIMNGLHQLYTSFFKQLKAIEFRGPIVVALPFFKRRNKPDLTMKKTLEAIDSMGFEAMSFLPASLSKDPLDLRYSRPNQSVGRAIYRFQFTR